MELSPEVMYKASLDRDPDFEGVFWLAVKTTGIFCRPFCRARKPKLKNVEFFTSIKDAMNNGYRGCKVCKPLENPEQTPEYIQSILNELNINPETKITDQTLHDRGIDPASVRRWFQKNHDITFHAFQRTHRLNAAFKKLNDGQSVIETAIESGFESLSGFTESFKNTFGISASSTSQRNVIDLKRLETPLGPMLAAADQNGICLLEFGERKTLQNTLLNLAKVHHAIIIWGENPYFELLQKELNLYFEGRLKIFTVPLSFHGTAFQKQVWSALQQIPYGETWSYRKQAEFLGNAKKVRAVANANGLNKIAILVPCHRVIGTNGTLTGYAGGIWRKQKLLELEKSILL